MMGESSRRRRPAFSPQRVLIVSSYIGRPGSLVGGGETYAELLASQLADRGHDIYMGCWHAGTISLPRTSNTLPARQVRIKSAIDLFAIVSLIRIILRDRIGLIIANSPKEYWPALIASKLTGRKVILVRHLTRRISAASRTLINCWAECIIAVSHAVRLGLERSGVSSDIIREIPNGLPVDRIKASSCERDNARAETGCGPEDLVIGFAGRLHPEKGLGVLMQAFGRIAPLYPRTRLLIAGEGPERQTMLRAAEDMGLDSRVRFTGRVDPVYRMYAAMDIFVMPSVCEEAFGFAAAEAMAMGRPVIASATGGLPELITHEVDGLLVPPAEPDAIAAALVRLIENPAERKTLGTAGQKKVTDLFSEQAQSDRTNDLVLEIMKGETAGLR